MEDKINIRLVKQKINDINYDYDILYNEIENKMKNNDIIDLGVKKINFCGLFNITIDVIPDIIKKKNSYYTNYKNSQIFTICRNIL